MTRQDVNQALLQTSFLYGANSAYIEALQAKYEKDPMSVEPGWRDFFAALGDDPASVNKTASGARESSFRAATPIHYSTGRSVAGCSPAFFKKACSTRTRQHLRCLFASCGWTAVRRLPLPVMSPRVCRKLAISLHVPRRLDSSRSERRATRPPAPRGTITVWSCDVWIGPLCP